MYVLRDLRATVMHVVCNRYVPYVLRSRYVCVMYRNRYARAMHVLCNRYVRVM